MDESFGTIEAGMRLNEYEIVSPLGAGGMGEVFLARDVRLERMVALKVLRMETGADPSRTERFASEAKAASALNHPNVAHVYGIGRCGEICFIAMELVKGKTLRHVTLTQDELIDVAMQAAAALDAAHREGIIHRDIKPANIMRTESGLVKVLDFGLAKRVQTAGLNMTPGLTEQGTVLGTLGYMSPEQLLGREMDQRTDIFSLGVVLYELLENKLPFAADSYQAALAEVVGAGKTPEQNSISAKQMGPLRQVVLKCIDRDPDQRYQSASHLIEALLHARNPEPVSAKKSRRDWLWASGVALATGGLAAFRYWPDAHAPVASGPIDSLAVMPFSGGGNNNTDIDYLREGIAESLTNKLAAMANLRVMSRDSTFRQRDLPAVDAGRKLAVRGVITGTIHKIEDALIVSAELVDSANGSRLWGDEFRGAATDVLVFRDKIAASIAGKLQMQLKGSAEMPATVSRETANNEAHDLYMKGRFYSGKVDFAEIRKGIEHFEKAIALDPGYALAHAARAEAHIFIADLFVPGKDALPAARESARKALEADPQLAEGHMASALVSQLADLDWGRCETELRKAIALNPHLAIAYAWLGWVLSATGQREEGLAASRQAVSKEPHSPLNHALLSANLYYAHDDEGAFHEAGEALQIDPQFHLAQMWRGLSMIQRGYSGAVLTKLEQARRKHSSPVITAALGRAYAAAGKTEKARAMLDALHKAAQTQHVSAILFAELNAALKENEAALDWLEKAYETRAKLLIWTKLAPAYDGLRKEPRFQTLLSKMHL